MSIFDVLLVFRLHRHTSDIRYAQNPRVSRQHHAALVRVEGTSSRHRSRDLWRRAVGEVGLRVCARLVRWLLHCV